MEQDNFKWTDKLVQEFALGVKVKGNAEWIQPQMEEFKKSKELLQVPVEDETVMDFDYNNGALVFPDQINKWHKEVVANVRNGTKSSKISSGRGMVIANLVHYSHETNPSIEVIEITNGYKRYEYKNAKIKPTETNPSTSYTEQAVTPKMKGLTHGIYIINWEGGGTSVASIGYTHDGTNWYSPCNWTSKDNKSPMVASTDFKGIKSIQLIRANDYEGNRNEQTPSTNTDTPAVQEPTALFTTEDGVEITDRRHKVAAIRKGTFELQEQYEGDSIAVWLNGWHTTKWLMNPTENDKRIIPLIKEHYLIFSTLEAANEWILENKPCLSLNEVKQITAGRITPSDWVRLEHSAKLKITNTNA